MALTPHASYTTAAQMVAAGLTSGTIKLLGASTGGANDVNIKEDAKYLNGLINALAKNLQGGGA